jgi:AcrR family transcriptional regulator
MSAAVERRLLDAALDVLGEHGVAGLTVEKIAKAAGVPRTTFYRRWKTASEAVAAAVNAAFAEANPETPATGDLREDLRVLGRNVIGIANNPRLTRAFTFMITEMEFNAAFRATALEIIRRRRRPAAAVIARAQKANEVSSDLDSDALVDAFAGALLYRVLFRIGPLDLAYVDRLVDVIAGTGRRRRR